MKTRNKLMTAVIMLVISAVMLSTASYAWFTISTNPEIKGLETQVVVNENLEIAYATSTTVPGAGAAGDTTKMDTWGNLIDFDSGTGHDDYNALDYTLRPVKLDGDYFQYPTYGADGRINQIVDFTLETTDVGAANLADTDGKIYGYYFDIWMRSNMNGVISLDEATERSAEGTMGSGSILTVTGGSDTALAMAGDYMKVGYKVIGSSALAYADNAAGGTITYPPATVAVTENITAFTKEETTAGVYKLTGEITGTGTANTAYLVRIYVWLDGESITNAAASLSAAEIAGTLTLQFTNGAAASMDGQD